MYQLNIKHPRKHFLTKFDENRIAINIFSDFEIPIKYKPLDHFFKNE